MSGFVIVHRYAYVLLPLEGDPRSSSRARRRYVGEHGTTWIEDQVFVDKPGDWLADQVRGQARRRLRARLRDDRARLPRARTARPRSSPGTSQFDHARAVKSELELESVRDSVRINTEGFWIFLEHFAPGKTEREILAHCEQYFVEEGCGRLDDGHGPHRPERRCAPRVQDRRATTASPPTDMVLPSLEVAGAGRSLGRGLARDLPGRAERRDASRCSRRYEEYYEAATRRAARRRDGPRRAPRGLEGLSSTAASSSATSPAIRSG